VGASAAWGGEWFETVWVCSQKQLMHVGAGWEVGNREVAQPSMRLLQQLVVMFVSR
jgi:hypothetical protein